jgi:ATP-dependent DNA helicase PIF1
VHRQADAPLVSMLQLLRRGVVNDSVVGVLRMCTLTVLGEGATRIAARNETVDAHNKAKLDELPGQAISFQAEDHRAAEDTHSALNQGPLERTVHLKPGALVVVVMNDSSMDLLNGDRGTVKILSAHGAQVRFDRTGALKWVQPRTWTTLGGSTRAQLPLRLAWALTVHRCQGTSLGRVEVDLTGVFEVGQAYTALSRATSLAGLRVMGLDQWLSNKNLRNVAEEVLSHFPAPTEAP